MQSAVLLAGLLTCRSGVAQCGKVLAVFYLVFCLVMFGVVTWSDMSCGCIDMCGDSSQNPNEWRLDILHLISSPADLILTSSSPHLNVVTGVATTVGTKSVVSIASRLANGSSHAPAQTYRN
jgi:hypothetical protein